MNDGGAGSLFLIVFLPLVLVGFIIWLWALIDAIRVPDDSMYRAGNKLIWVLVIVFAQLIGAIATSRSAVPRPPSATARPRPCRRPRRRGSLAFRVEGLHWGGPPEEGGAR
jgi:hypothetical protein